MFDFIEKLRQKPIQAKKRIAFLVAFSLSGLIFAVWLSVIYPDFMERQKREEKVANLEPSPISTFSQTISSGMSGIKEQFSKIKSVMFLFSGDSEYYRVATSSLLLASSTEDE